MNDFAVLHAWVDESMQTTGGGFYVLAASVADPAQCDPIREELRGLLLGRAKRLHWRDQVPKRRRVIATVIAGLTIPHTVVVGAPISPQRQERARRLCLERLLFELIELGVTQVWLETRTQSLNARDLTVIEAFRAKNSISESLTVRFAQPEQEPMLWLPDAVAGAVGGRLRSEDVAYGTLFRSITLHTIEIS